MSGEVVNALSLKGGGDLYDLIAQGFGQDMEIRHYVLFALCSIGKITPSKANIDSVGRVIADLIEEGMVSEVDIAVYGSFYKKLGAAMEIQGKAAALEAATALDKTAFGAEIKQCFKRKKYYKVEGLERLEQEKALLEEKIKAIKSACDDLEFSEKKEDTLLVGDRDYQIKPPMYGSGSTHMAIKLPNI